MITTITHLLRTHPEWLTRPGAGLSFMKMSTPTSGTAPGEGNVLLFVFEDGAEAPTLCVKTTRTYSAGESIRRNHRNLRLLEEGVRGSGHAGMFARPLYLHDDGDTIFCIESVCPGVKFAAQTRGVELVVDKYIAWQSHLARNAKEFQTLGHLRLPALVQHGDMTPDNVLVSGGEVHIIDYDYAGQSKLPGFDLFIFLSKVRPSPATLSAWYKQYFPRYFKNIGVQVESYEGLIPFYCAEEEARKAKKT